MIENIYVKIRIETEYCMKQFIKYIVFFFLLVYAYKE